MTLTILYFAAVGDLVGKPEESLVVPPSVATVGALATHLAARYPALSERLRYVKFARNEAFADASEPLADGDVVALLPPVAGGSGDGRAGRGRAGGAHALSPRA